MQLKSTIIDKWKLCIIASTFCCLILLFFLNQSDKLANFTTSTPLQISEAPLPSIIADPPKSQPKLLTVNPPPKFNIINESCNVTSNPIKKLQNFTLISTIAKPNATIHKLEKPKPKEKIGNQCDLFNGRWVYKAEEKPSYDAISCPFIEEKMSCRKNGRPDLEYEKWRWEANDCDIPLFNARDMLEKLRNKRVIIIGDSLNRNMWESLACLLYSSIHPSRAEVYAKIRNYKVLKAKDYNATIEFHWSPFLTEFDENHKSGKKVLVLDKLSSNSKQWRGADIMVFNSGHWWTHRGKFKAWDLFQYKGKLIERMPILRAYDRGMKTWANWIQRNVDPKKTIVFFRSISANHNVGLQWCYNSTHPIMDKTYANPFPKSMIDIIEGLIKGLSKSHVKYLNITELSKYRSDAHPSVYRNSQWKIYTNKYKRLIPSIVDCSHWCLPGLPDTWNRLLYAKISLI